MKSFFGLVLIVWLQSKTRKRQSNNFGVRFGDTIVTRMNWNKSNSESHLQHANKTLDNLNANLKTTMHYIFGSIAALSFFGNFLLCLVICRRRKLLSKTYNILMSNLAITDMLTGLQNFLFSVYFTYGFWYAKTLVITYIQWTSACEVCRWRPY